MDLEELKGALVHLAERIPPGAMDSPAAQDLLLQFKRDRALGSIWLNRADGSFAFSDPPAGLVNASRRPWFRAVLSGEPYVSAPYISAQSRAR